jgi:hypothetical protein
MLSWKLYAELETLCLVGNFMLSWKLYAEV